MAPPSRKRSWSVVIKSAGFSQQRRNPAPGRRAAEFCIFRRDSRMGGCIDQRMPTAWRPGLGPGRHGTGFTGLYVDANALLRQHLRRLPKFWVGAYVDGGIIGPPALKPGTTRLYLSGHHAPTVSAWFSTGSLQAIAMPMRDDPDAQVAASMLKMAYAAYSKGAKVLLSVNALAEAGGVGEALHQEAISAPICSSAVSTRRRRRRVRHGGLREKCWKLARPIPTPDCWIASHAAAAAIYGRMQELKDYRRKPWTQWLPRCWSRRERTVRAQVLVPALS